MQWIFCDFFLDSHQCRVAYQVLLGYYCHSLRSFSLCLQGLTHTRLQSCAALSQDCLKKIQIWLTSVLQQLQDTVIGYILLSTLTIKSSMIVPLNCCMTVSESSERFRSVFWLLQDSHLTWFWLSACLTSHIGNMIQSHSIFVWQLL